MDPADAHRAVAAAMSVATSLGLAADESVVLHDSNRLVVRLLPCDTVARVSPAGWFSAAREVELARQLAAASDAPIVRLDPRVEPRVVAHDGFEVALWAYFEASPSRELVAADYAHALERLHVALRRVDVSAPHVSERVAEVRGWLVDADVTPELAPADRALLLERLELPRGLVSHDGSTEQLLHGEPHPWNLLATSNGPLFVDFENCAPGPIEFDVAWVPAKVAEQYRHVDQQLVGECRRVVLAIVAAHRWRQDDQHPSGRESGVAFLEVLRAGPPWPALDGVRW